MCKVEPNQGGAVCGVPSTLPASKIALKELEAVARPTSTEAARA